MPLPRSQAESPDEDPVTRAECAEHVRDQLEKLRKARGNLPFEAFVKRYNLDLGRLIKWRAAGSTVLTCPRSDHLLNAAMSLGVTTDWLLGREDAPEAWTQKLDGDDLLRDVTSQMIRDGADEAKPPAWIRTLLPKVITRDVVKHELRRFALDLVQRAWRLLERRRAFAVIQAQLQRACEQDSLDEGAMEALVTIESEDYFASGEHGGELGRAFRAQLLESARREGSAKPAPRSGPGRKARSGKSRVAKH